MSTDNANQIKCTRAKEVKNQIIDTMIEFKEMCKSLPNPPSYSYNNALQMLQKRNCVISICGEASLGKSQFINALIGKNILPVNEHSTTSQVFHVTYSDKESYTLFFEDGSSEPLNNADEVARYGTALETTIGDERIKGRVLKYIEVKTPGKYLIPGVTFYDTPGLGSLHFSHDDITLNCLEESDAVLFFCSTERPFTKAELEFLNRVYRRTDNVLFVQSLSDLFDNDAQESIASRNKELLNNSSINELIQNKYDRTVQFKFYPLSSLNLIESSEASEPELAQIQYKYSHFEALREAIELLVFRTVDYSSSLVAYNELYPYYENVVSSIKNENDQLSKNTLVEREKFEKKLEERKKEFEEKFGENSVQQKELKSEFEAVFDNIRNNAKTFFGKNGYLFDEINKQLYYFPEDLSELGDYANKVSSLIRQISEDEWNDIVKYAQEAIGSICANFKLEMDNDSFQNNQSNNLPAVSISFDSSSLARSTQGRQDSKRRIKEAQRRNAAITVIQWGVTGLGWLFSFIDPRAKYVAATVNTVLDEFRVEVPDTPLLTAPERDFGQIKEDFRKSVISSIQSMSQVFLGVDGNSGKAGELINAFQDDAKSLIKKSLEARRSSFDKELQNLKDNAHLTEQQAQDKIKTNMQFLSLVEDIGVNIKDFGNELNNLKSFYDSI